MTLSQSRLREKEVKSVVGNAHQGLSGSNLIQIATGPSPAGQPGLGHLFTLPTSTTDSLQCSTLGLEPIRSGLHSLAWWSSKKLIIKQPSRLFREGCLPLTTLKHSAPLVSPAGHCLLH